MKRETEKMPTGQVSAGATEAIVREDPQSLAAHIVETIPLPLLVLNSALEVLACNPAFTTAYNLLHQDVLGKRLPDVGEGQWDSPDFLERLDEVLPEGQPLRPWEAEREFPGRGSRVLRMQGRRLDHVQMILLIVEDITQRHRKQREQAMLMQELAHRMKNVFAAIEGLAEKSLLRSDVANPQLSFLPQLRTYLRVQRRLLTDRGTCDIRDLVHEALEPHLFDLDRLTLDGGPLALDQGTCTVLALVLHELQANALKFGALSTDEGTVDVCWRRDHDEQVCLCWSERAGPTPDVPVVEGFGISFVREYLAYQLDGEATFDFLAEGLRFQVRFRQVPRDESLETQA